VPAGLGELSAPLHSLIEFLEIDEDLVEIAAAASAALDAGPCRKELDAWIRSLPQDEKDDLLVSAVSEPSERWKNDLLRRFQRQNAAYTSSETSSVQRRSAGDLLAAVHARAEERARILSAKRAEEAAQKKAEDEAKRVRYLDQLEKRERDVWAQIAAQIQKRQPNEYDKAVILLTDLRAVADRRGRVSEFQSALETLRQAHSSKLSFLRRLEKAKL